MVLTIKSVKSYNANLNQVSIIRPILILLLVFYHSFAIFSGAWEPIAGIPDIPVYWWLDKLSYSFMLETFVFISGYVFGYQIIKKIKNGEYKVFINGLLRKKFKRLIIPSVIFSFLYIVFFLSFDKPWYEIIYSLFNGVAHMWFLPMLFWCFVGVWMLEKAQLNHQWVFAIVLLASLLSFLPLPLRISNAMYYFIFFYVGYLIQRNTLSLERLYNKKNIYSLFLLFIILFYTLTMLKTHLGTFEKDGLFAKVILAFAGNLIKLTYSSAGLAMLFAFVGFYEIRHKNRDYSQLRQIGSSCFGVYLFQQFILIALYRHSDFPTQLSPYLLPWASFFLTLLFSYFASYFLLKTKVGKFLIG